MDKTEKNIILKSNLNSNIKTQSDKISNYNSEINSSSIKIKPYYIVHEYSNCNDFPNSDDERDCNVNVNVNVNVNRQFKLHGNANVEIVDSDDNIISNTHSQLYSQKKKKENTENISYFIGGALGGALLGISASALFWFKND